MVSLLMPRTGMAWDAEVRLEQITMMHRVMIILGYRLSMVLFNINDSFGDCEFCSSNVLQNLCFFDV